MNAPVGTQAAPSVEARTIGREFHPTGRGCLLGVLPGVSATDALGELVEMLAHINTVMTAVADGTGDEGDFRCGIWAGIHMLETAQAVLESVERGIASTATKTAPAARLAPGHASVSRQGSAS